MQLLHSRAIPGAEFVSFSVLLRRENGPGSSGPQHPVHGVEPIVFPNPLSTISQPCCVQVLSELHSYINHVTQSSSKSKTSNSSSSSTTTRQRFLQDDENTLSAASSNTTADVQVFRTQHGNGIALHYRIVRDKKRIAPLLSLLFTAGRSAQGLANGTSTTNMKQSKAAAAAAAFGGALEKEATGIVFCVGVSGMPSMYSITPMIANLGVRMRDCLDILQRTPGSTIKGSSKTSTKSSSSSANLALADMTAVRSLVTTLLMTEDEDRITNSLAASTQRLLIASSVKKGQQHSSMENPNAVDPDENPLHFNSSDHARLVVERLAILSVCESDTTFRRFEGKSREGTTKRRKGRKSNRDADLDGFDFRGGDMRNSTPRKSINSHLDNTSTSQTVGSSSSSLLSAPPSDTSSISRRSGASSTTSSGVALRGPRKDTSSRSAARGKSSTAPLLSAPSRDSGSRNRRSQATSNGPVIANFPGASTHSNAAVSMRSLQSQSDAVSLSSGRTPPGSITSRSNNQNQNRQQFDPFSSQTFDTPSISESTFGQSDSTNNIQSNGNNAMFSPTKERSSRGIKSGSTKMLVNVALNEDLTCFYKMAKMSSCSVEGVVQVQVQSNVDQSVPFSLLVRDPAKHIQSIQENKKFADNMAESIHAENSSNKPDYMFTVSVPRSDNYFPVMRYKCGPELRPVPIRVQTRVREEDEHYRVALQISSNPHNEDNLTDLTIIMGVPKAVLGESLTTSPPGGVWNASKRSVIWCVSELGGGEKFQLQARFEINYDAPAEEEDEMPKFPVLVRCQCMYAQLSDIEVDVRGMPQVVDAEVRMKLARRFRLSHRERS